jgi:hypothetical protein
MRRFLAIVIALAGPGISTSVAQSSVPPMPRLPAASPLESGLSGVGTSQSPSGQSRVANSTPCSGANPGTAMLPTFDGGGLNLGSTATQSSILTQGGTTGSMGAAAGTSAPCSATNGSSGTTAGMATASTPNTSSLGTTGLGTGGLGATALGTAGLASSSAGSASTPTSTSTSQTTPTLAGSTGSATICATNLGTMSASAGMSTGDQIGQGASGTVADPAETLANTIPSPALTLSGSASVPNLAGSCANMP